MPNDKKPFPLVSSWRDYPAMLAALPPDSGTLRELCLNDLFFLLRYGLNRYFIDSDWWFARCREVQAAPDGYLDLWAREHGKDLADDTPMLTTNRGWTTHGDLVVGDSVYSPSGNPVKVVAISERFAANPCYKITMKDGAEIVCGRGHLWRIRKKSKPRIGNWHDNRRTVSFEDVVVTADQLYEMFVGGQRIDFGASAPLEMPESNQPIDAYIFGCWLGDGHSASARFTTSKTDFPHFEAEFIRAGHTLTVYEKRSNCLGVTIDQYDKKKFCSRGHDKEIVGTYKLQCNACRKLWENGKKAPPATQTGMPYRLRALGLLKENKKFIPDVYLNASIEQRTELLCGLMDTDGTCDTGGTASFCNTNKKLAEQCYELATGLGLKPRFRTYKAKLDGRIIGDCYNVAMQAHRDMRIFKLKRKADRSIFRSRYVDSRYVKSIEPVEPCATSCIQVDNPNGLYLAGKSLIPTHNSTIITIGKTIQDILNNPEITIGIFSHTRPIAKAFLRVIKREFESNELLKTLFPDILFANPAGDSPKWSEDGGILVIRRSNPPEATVEAYGLVDGMPTSRHFGLRVYDDCVTADSVSTPEQMRKTIDAMDMSNNLGQRGGARRMIGTRYKMGDLYDDYVKRGTVIPRIYPATDNGRADGKPVYFSQEEWESKLQDMSPAIIASQMLQNPLAEDSVIFQPDWFRLWPAFLDDARTKPNPLPAFDMVFLSLDGAFSEKTTADDSCLLAIGLFKATEGSEKYSMMIVDCFMEKVAYPKLRDEVIRQFQNKFGATEKSVDGIIIEDKASGSALIPDLRRGGMTVYPYNPGNLDKTARANLVSHLVRDGYLWLPESSKRKGYVMSWVSRFHEQMLYFPNVKMMDGVDACVQALSTLDKMGFLRGRMVPENKLSYWKRMMKSPYG